jgi:hypothetical protein
VLTQNPVAEVVSPIVEVAPELIRDLESGAREFLIAQGIFTVEVFLSSKAATMADALMDWRARKKKASIAFLTAQQRIN